MIERASQISKTARSLASQKGQVADLWFDGTSARAGQAGQAKITLNLA
jgi:hypothetical protein